MVDVYGKIIEGRQELEQPGDFIYYVRNRSKRKDGIAGLVMVCPCGCGELKELSFGPRNGYNERWTWDGNLTEPTITPEIHFKQCGWRGYLWDGIFMEIGDN